MRTIAIINQKGGCGKTTTAINLAGILARRGMRTLLVDMDPQSHCAAGLAIPEQRIDLDIGDAMLAPPEQPLDTTRLLWRASRNLDLAPSRMKLAGLEASRGGLADKPDKDRRLAGVLARLSPNYDVCLVDCSPSIGLLTFNALVAATEVLIPVETSYFALQGATKQVNTIRTLAKRLGSTAPYWLVATIHDESSALARDLLEEMRRRFGKRVAPAVIRRDTTLKEAASFGQPVVEYAASSEGARDYGALADWLLGHGGAAAPAPEIEAGSVIVESTGLVGDAGGGGGRNGSVPPIEAVAAGHADGGGGVAVAVAPAAAPQAASPHAGATRAEDLAQRARLLLLKRADEQLRKLASRSAEPAVEPKGPDTKLVAATVPARGEIPATDGRTEAARRLAGVRGTRSGVLFVQPLDIGSSVAIAGDFNNWSASSHTLRRNDALGVFELCVPLPAGSHQYRLVVDGRWIADPSNERCEPNPFGELNSIVDSDGAGRA